jgi:hypothetical protein
MASGMIQETLLAEVGMWRRVTKFDPRAAALADRHYSRGKVGAPQFMPPGRTIVLLTPAGDAVWGTHWPDPKFTLDGLDAWRCSIFRNEGPALSSELILEAMQRTAQTWQERPADGWLTFIDRSKVRSTNPGYCFLMAGWQVDSTWWHPKLRRLRAEVVE